MGLPGKHPGCAKCPNRGTPNCRCLPKNHEAAHSGCSCGKEAPVSGDNDMIAEITRKVLAALGK